MAVQKAWKDVSVVIFGRTIEGILGVKYKRSVKKEHVFGRGNKSLGIVTGNEEISGSFTLLQDELEAMVAAATAAGGTLNDASFDIIHSYENAGGAITTDIVIGAQITDYEKALAQGETQMKIELPYMAVDLRESVA